jgi:hypothetical protein
MPLVKIQLKPGINRDQTNYSGEGGWWHGDKIRFFSGFPQKLGGWTKYTVNTFNGVCRQMWNWVTSYQDNLLALGTNNSLYVEAGGVLSDITPILDTFSTPDTDNCIDVTDDSNLVTFNITGHGAEVGTSITVSGVVGPIGGIPQSQFNATFVVAEVVDGDTFKVQVTTTATSTVTGSGGTAIQVIVRIPPGNAIPTEGYGWGTGPWGDGAWGVQSSVPIFLPQRDWWLDNFDNDLVANIRNGAIYYWARGGGLTPAFSTPAVLLSSMMGASDVPDVAMQILISQNDKHLLAFGCTPFGGGLPDPLLIRWADQDTPTDWTPSPTNSAGFIRISRGSRIIRALPTRQEIVVWTESHLYALQFLGTTDVYGLQEYADNISIIGPRAVASASNVTYWMGQEKFYAYSGRVETLPCTVRNYVFTDLNFNQTEQIVSGTNEGYNEVWWFYPSLNSNYNDRYVVYNHLEKIWYYGTLERTAWLDSALREYPQACEYPDNAGTSLIYNHEDGVNADVLPLVSYIESNDFDLDDGDSFALTKRIIPDVNFLGSDLATNPTPEVTMTIKPRNFPGSGYEDDPSDTQRVIETSFDRYTDQVFIRARARQMALKIASEQLGVQWQLGSPRIEMRQDGKR